MINSLRNLAIAAVAAAAVAAPVTASSASHEMTLGVKTGFVTRNNSALAGIYFQYRFTSFFAVSPNIDYVFRADDRDAFLFNIDAHFPIPVLPARWDIYPIVGVNYVSWHHTVSPMVRSTDVSTRTNRFGGNFGLGFAFRATKSLKVTVEAKYNAVSRLSTGLFSVGIGYMF